MACDKESLHTGAMAGGDPLLGSALRSARKRRGLSQAAVGAAVARLAGLATPISGSAVGQWEKGESKPSTDNLILVCRFLQIKLEAATIGRDEPLDAPASELLNPTAQEFTIASDTVPLRRNMPQDVPVFGTAVGGADGEFFMNGEIVDRVRRPAALANAKHIYAVYVSGHSMEPRFENGDLVYVTPDRHPSIGDYVLIEMAAQEGEKNGAAYIKRLVRRTSDKIVCEQFNPQKQVTFPTRSVSKLHRILPWNEVLGG